MYFLLSLFGYQVQGFVIPTRINRPIRRNSIWSRGSVSEQLVVPIGLPVSSNRWLHLYYGIGGRRKMLKSELFLYSSHTILALTYAKLTIIVGSVLIMWYKTISATLSSLLLVGVGVCAGVPHVEAATSQNIGLIANKHAVMTLSPRNRGVQRGSLELRGNQHVHRMYYQQNACKHLPEKSHRTYRKAGVISPQI